MGEAKTTALVTGASSGLGAEYCRQLAPRCDVIIAVARRGEQLFEALADAVEQQVAACSRGDALRQARRRIRLSQAVQLPLGLGVCGPEGNAPGGPLQRDVGREHVGRNRRPHSILPEAEAPDQGGNDGQGLESGSQRPDQRPPVDLAPGAELEGIGRGRLDLARRRARPAGRPFTSPSARAS